MSKIERILKYKMPDLNKVCSNLIKNLKMGYINKELIASYGSHFIDKNDINNVISVLKGKH